MSSNGQYQEVKHIPPTRSTRFGVIVAGNQSIPPEEIRENYISQGVLPKDIHPFVFYEVSMAGTKDRIRRVYMSMSPNELLEFVSYGISLERGFERRDPTGDEVQKAIGLFQKFGRIVYQQPVDNGIGIIKERKVYPSFQIKAILGNHFKSLTDNESENHQKPDELDLESRI